MPLQHHRQWRRATRPPTCARLWRSRHPHPTTLSTGASCALKACAEPLPIDICPSGRVVRPSLENRSNGSYLSWAAARLNTLAAAWVCAPWAQARTGRAERGPNSPLIPQGGAPFPRFSCSPPLSREIGTRLRRHCLSAGAFGAGGGIASLIAPPVRRVMRLLWRALASHRTRHSRRMPLRPARPLPWGLCASFGTRPAPSVASAPRRQPQTLARGSKDIIGGLSNYP